MEEVREVEEEEQVRGVEEVREVEEEEQVREVEVLGEQQIGLLLILRRSGWGNTPAV